MFVSVLVKDCFVSGFTSLYRAKDAVGIQAVVDPGVVGGRAAAPTVWC